MSIADRFLQKKTARQAKVAVASTLVAEQMQEETVANDSKVGYVEAQVTPLDYMHEGKKLHVPAYTESGESMSYHDQYYQITRYKNGLPIEAKRMIDYTFDVESAAVAVEDDRNELNLDIEPSETYNEMMDAHKEQLGENDET